MLFTGIKRVCLFFTLLGIVFIPFPFNVFPYQVKITEFLFNKVIRFFAVNLFNLSHEYPEISSDSSALFILMFILFGLSILLASSVFFLKKWKRYEEKIFNLILLIVCYYLILQLLNYGINKLFKAQFYLPEPNILYTPFGQLDKDILYWSTMGVSYEYNLFLGITEILAALLLALKKTRVLGLLLSTAIFINVIAVNFSFDISVKMYSSFLFALSIILLSPFLTTLYHFFIQGKPAQLKEKAESFSVLSNNFIKPFLKALFLSIILLEALSPFLLTGNFNDDYTQRPFLHGAYTITNNSYETTPYRRLFIHRKGYIIFQDQNELMTDYQLTIKKDQFILTDYSLNEQVLNYKYDVKNQLLELDYFHQGKKYQLRCKSLNWKSLPVLKSNFHWFVNEF